LNRRTYPNGTSGITISSIRCKYYNKEGYIEQECKKKQYDLKGEWKANDCELVHNALLQFDQNFIQVFMCGAKTEKEQPRQKKIWTNFCYKIDKSTYHTKSIKWRTDN
jgi:hypothetical protein